MDITENKYYINNPQMFLRTKTIYETSGRWLDRNIERDHEIKQWIDSQLPMLKDAVYNIRTKVYWILNGLYDFPKCQNPKCTNRVGIGVNIKLPRVYRKTCCQDCAAVVWSMTNIETCRRKYGVDNVFQLEDIKKKSEDKKEELYGDPHYCNHKQSEETYFKKHGCRNILQTPDGLNNIQEKTLKKYGTRIVLQSEKGKRQVEQTCLNRYGVKHISYLKSTQEHYEETCLKTYGVRRPLQNPDKLRESRSKYFYNGIYFDSMPEIAMYIYLTDNNIQFEYHPDIKFTYYAEKEKVYIPDFKVGNVLYEIKGDQFLAEDGKWCNPYDHSLDESLELKHQCVLNNGVNILYEKDYQKYVDYCNNKFGNNQWYKKFRNKKKKEV